MPPPGVEAGSTDLVDWLDFARTAVRPVVDLVADGFGLGVGTLELLGFRYQVRPKSERVDALFQRGSRKEHREDYDELVEQGITAIIDLCAERTLDHDHAEAAGLRFKNIRVLDSRSPTFDQLREFFDFLREVEAEGGRAYVHCEFGNGRTGLFVACYRMVVYGWSLAEALAEAQDHTLGKLSPFFPNQRAFLERFAAAVAEGELREYRGMGLKR